MFSQNSRYRNLPHEVTIDHTGQRRRALSLRSLPQVSGQFLHTITAGDRLDHLAYKYYNQPHKWWRICDANPDFMAPQALLGKTSLVTQRFPFEYDHRLEVKTLEKTPTWAILMQQITAQVGVQEVWLADDESSLFVRFNQINLQPSVLSEMIKAFGRLYGFSVDRPQTLGRIGKQVLIPPNSQE